jgi:hypothetical protein
MISVIGVRGHAKVRSDSMTFKPFKEYNSLAAFKGSGLKLIVQPAMNMVSIAFVPIATTYVTTLCALPCCPAVPAVRYSPTGRS